MRRGDNLWIGLATVIRKPGCEIIKNSKGAFANVMGCATSTEQFKEKVENAVRGLELELVDLEDVQMFSERSKGDVVFDDQIYEIKKRIEEDGEAIAFGTFYKWKHDDLSQ